MARFVPRTLRGQRSESDPGESAAAAPEETAPGGRAPARKPSPRRTPKADRPEPGARGSAPKPAAEDADPAATDAADAAETASLAKSDAATGTDAAGEDIVAADEAAEADEATAAEDAADGETTDADGDTTDADGDTTDADGDTTDADGETTDADGGDEGDEAGSDGATGSVDVTKPRAVRPADSGKAGGGAKRDSRGSDRKRPRADAESGRGRGAGRKVVAAPRTGSNRRAKLAQAQIGRLRRTAISLVVWLVVFGALAGVAVYFHQSGEATDSAARDATSAARSAAEAIFSYDYRSFDESVANGRQHVTGKFKSEYAKTTAGLAKTAVKEKAIMRARVSTAGVVEASRDRVDVLLFVNQYRRNANITGEKVDENRVVLTMVYVEDDSGSGDWLVSNAVAY
ncbi:MAG: hypothetical protein ACRDT6_16515 [Micromonosporaceae bacterium]